MREAIVQSLENLRANKLRSFLTMFGILWGMISIVILSAMGEGFRRGNEKVLLELGKNIGIVWGGRTSLQAGGERAGRQIFLTIDDARAIAAESSLVAVVSPELERRRRPGQERLQLRDARASAAWSRRTRISARSKLEYGRQFTWNDEQQVARVAIVGYDMADQLFGKRNIVGETLIAERPDLTRSSARSARRNRTATTAVPTTTRSSSRSRRCVRDLPRPDARAGTLSDIVVAPNPFVVDQLPGVLDARTGRIEDIEWPLVRNVRDDPGPPARLRSRPTRRRSRCGTPRSRR